MEACTFSPSKADEDGELHQTVCRIKRDVLATLEFCKGQPHIANGETNEIKTKRFHDLFKRINDASALLRGSKGRRSRSDLETLDSICLLIILSLDLSDDRGSNPLALSPSFAEAAGEIGRQTAIFFPHYLPFIREEYLA